MQSTKKLLLIARAGTLREPSEIFRFSKGSIVKSAKKIQSDRLAIKGVVQRQDNMLLHEVAGETLDAIFRGRPHRDHTSGVIRRQRVEPLGLTSLFA